MKWKENLFVVIVVIAVLFVLLCFVGFAVSIVMCFTGAYDEWRGLLYSCGLVVMVVLMSSAK